MRVGERGQSEVIGVVLLLGITIAAVTATVATGSVALGLITDEAQSASVENGMSQLSSQSSLVALGETDARRFDLGSVDGGQLRLDEDAGHVTVRVENGTDGDTTVYDGPIGTLEYVGSDRTVALQGGGVWTVSNGYGRMVSPPEYHYRGTTLTFPIVRLNGTEQTPQSGTGVVRRVPGDSDNVTETANPLENGTVVVEVQSDYYEGWYEFFTQRADGSVTKYDGNRTTVARLVVPDDVAFDRAISLGGEYTHNSGNNGLDESLYEEDEVHPSPGPMIDSALREGADSGEPLSNCFDADTCTGGTYYASGDVDVGQRVEFDTSGDDVTIAVDGDLDLGGNELEITNDGDGVVRYYVNGSVFANGDATVGTTSDAVEAQRNRFYVRDGFLEDGPGQGSVDVDAVVYAPNSDTNLAGSVTLRGGFIFDTLTTKSNAFTVEHDDTLDDIEIRIGGGSGRNSITYLHVSENVVEVDFD
ncbi:DUF7289 family protein [Halorubrum salinum]|uniref:DUF7289 family protein n=1 Tax=Halorubrum salinum TaxID=767517 RepID=UPI0021136199|nr:archaellin/type IV pilin N-terminal domain-containing protein [Halorubrum salinum]